MRNRIVAVATKEYRRVCCSVLRYVVVPVCCSTWQCVVLYGSVLQSLQTRLLQCITVCGGVLQYVAGSVLQCVAMC